MSANEASQAQLTRRQWFKTVGRYGALLGIVGGVGSIGRTPRVSAGRVAACGLLARCDLTAAREARAVTALTVNGGQS